MSEVKVSLGIYSVCFPLSCHKTLILLHPALDIHRLSVTTYSSINITQADWSESEPPGSTAYWLTHSTDLTTGAAYLIML